MHEDRTRQIYDAEVYDRLQTVKEMYDPYNRFRLNHNIPPRFSA
jgi:FAD/FMN-containing dehydrogenase